jgi:hypothetical protein
LVAALALDLLPKVFDGFAEFAASRSHSFFRFAPGALVGSLGLQIFVSSQCTRRLLDPTLDLRLFALDLFSVHVMPPAVSEAKFVPTRHQRNHTSIPDSSFARQPIALGPIVNLDGTRLARDAVRRQTNTDTLNLGPPA